MAEQFDYLDVECITIPLEDGGEIECAIIDQFDYEGQSYMVVSPLDGDEIQEEMYIYRCTEDGDDVILDYIDDEDELNAVSSFYADWLETLDIDD